MKGSGSHDKTGRHCLPLDPNGKLDIVRDAGSWLRDDDGQPTRAVPAHLLGRLHVPQRRDDRPEDLERRSARHDRGARRARVELTMKKLNIGMIGYGFMGRAHSNAFRKVDQLLRPAVPAGPQGRLRAQRRAAPRRSPTTGATNRSRPTGASWSTRKDIDLIDIASPNDTHAEIAIAAAKAGKMVMCEKPLGRERRRRPKRWSRPSRRPACRTWSGTTTAACPPSRSPSSSSTKARLGRIFHYRAKFLQDWTISTDLPQGGEGLWRLDVARRRQRRHRRPARPLHRHRASGSTAASTKSRAMTETFIKERKHNLTGKVEPVGIDDASLFLARFGNGSLATFEATRYARGHKALYTFEINGEHASIVWDLHDLHRLQYFDHRDEGTLRGWRSIHITDGDHPYMKHWWVPGLQIGYEHTFIHQVADFLTAAGEGKSAAPTFRDGLAPTTSRMRFSIRGQPHLGQSRRITRRAK